MTLGQFLGSIWNWFTGGVTNKIPADYKLEAKAGEMLKGLGTVADAASFAMARADAKYTELKNELVNHEALGQQVEEFLREKNSQAAARCAQLKVESAQKIAKLKIDYQALQTEAEQKALAYVDQKKVVDDKIAQLPELKNDIQLIALEEKIEKDMAQFDIHGATRSFDQIASEVTLRKSQLRNKGLLTNDPNRELDRAIKDSMQRKEIESVLKEAQAKIDSDSGIMEGEIVVDEEAAKPADEVGEARKLLEAPRYSTIFKPTASKPVAVEKRKQIGQ